MGTMLQLCAYYIAIHVYSRSRLVCLVSSVYTLSYQLQATGVPGADAASLWACKPLCVLYYVYIHSSGFCSALCIYYSKKVRT